MKIALVIGRKNSKRIKNKNFKLFCGKPIIFWPIKTLIKSNFFDKIYVSSDSKKINNFSNQLGIDGSFLRPKKYSADHVSTIKVVKYFIHKIEKKLKIKVSSLCCVYASAPFFTAKQIRKAYFLLVKKKKDFIFLANEIDNAVLRCFFMSQKKFKMFCNFYKDSRSQDLPKAYVDCGQFYWGKRNSWLNKKTILTSNSYFISTKKKKYIDINYEKDWKLAETKFKSYKIK